MSKTQRFREQHSDLLAVAQEIETLIRPNVLADNVEKARSALSRLFGKLHVHLSGEDQGLYPRLYASEDARLKSMAKQFSDEMGNITGVIKEYNQRWLLVSKIRQDPAGFCEQTAALLKALRNRIERENTQLYKLADEVP